MSASSPASADSTTAGRPVRHAGPSPVGHGAGARDLGQPADPADSDHPRPQGALQRHRARVRLDDARPAAPDPRLLVRLRCHRGAWDHRRAALPAVAAHRHPAVPVDGARDRTTPDGCSATTPSWSTASSLPGRSGCCGRCRRAFVEFLFTLPITVVVVLFFMSVPTSTPITIGWVLAAAVPLVSRSSSCSTSDCRLTLAPMSMLYPDVHRVVRVFTTLYRYLSPVIYGLVTLELALQAVRSWPSWMLVGDQTWPEWLADALRAQPARRDLEHLPRGPLPDNTVDDVVLLLAIVSGAVDRARLRRGLVDLPAARVTRPEGAVMADHRAPTTPSPILSSSRPTISASGSGATGSDTVGCPTCVARDRGRRRSEFWALRNVSFQITAG